MSVRNHVDKHIEINVGEFSFQNIIIFISRLFGRYETVASVVSFLPGVYYGLSQG
jgi:hypothetical protein